MRGSLFKFVAAISLANAALPFIPKPPPFRSDDIFTIQEASSFEQPISHKKPGLGTFQQAYWWNTTFWKGPGSPIVVFSPGEAEAAPYTGYLTDRALPGRLAKEVGGAVIMIEHRNWGSSLPYQVQTTENLQQHTLENAVADFVQFAKNVDLPFDVDNRSNAPQAPWIWTGGSYSGNLAAWIEKLAPGTFWAYHSSSAPVEAVYDYWSYFYPIQQGMPKNCSRDMEKLISYVDGVLLHGTEDEKRKLKSKFRMEVLRDDDFASGLTSPLGSWQGIQLYSGYSNFYQMCDAIEGAKGVESPGENGVGLPMALDNFAAWYTEKYLPGTCQSYGYAEWDDEYSLGCFDSYNTSSPAFADVSANNPFGRTWFWMTCHQPFFYWQTGAPDNRPSIVSRFVTPEYFQRQCALFFPGTGCNTYGSNKGKTAEQFNAKTDGWMLTNTTRLVWSNGEFDPWRAASVSSEFRPGGPLQSRPGAPVHLIPGARHCNDLLMKNGEVNSDMKEVINAEIQQIKAWVDEFYDTHGQKRSLSRRTRKGLGKYKLAVEPWDTES